MTVVRHGTRGAGNARPLLIGMALACAAALAAALVSQHVYGMQPCPWCVLQRLIFTLIGVAAAVGAVFSGPMPRRVAAGLAMLLALCGMAAALWQHFVAASSASCDLTLADRIMSGLGIDMALPEVYAAFASCADAKVNLFGVPYEFWSLVLFAALTVAALLVWRRAAVR
jgi:disulfide bond formation protein DsbB